MNLEQKKQLQQYLKEMCCFAKHLLKDKNERISFLVGTGMYTKQGKLKARYR